MLIGRHANRPAHDLPRRDLQPGIGLAGKFQPVRYRRAGAIFHRAVPALHAGALVVARPVRRVVREQDQPYLLVIAGVERHIVPQLRQHAPALRNGQQINLHWTVRQIRRQLHPPGRVISRRRAHVRLHRRNRDEHVAIAACRNFATRRVADANARRPPRRVRVHRHRAAATALHHDQRRAQNHDARLQKI